MKLKGSSPCAQKLATGPYPEQIGNAPHLHTIY